MVTPFGSGRLMISDSNNNRVMVYICPEAHFARQRFLATAGAANSTNMEKQHSLARDVALLHENEDFSDCTFIVKSSRTRIPAHKAIVTARSPVFCAMLLSGMLETTSAEIEVPFSKTVTKELLRFLYTDRCSAGVLDYANEGESPKLSSSCGSRIRGGGGLSSSQSSVSGKDNKNNNDKRGGGEGAMTGRDNSNDDDDDDDDNNSQTSSKSSYSSSSFFSLASHLEASEKIAVGNGIACELLAAAARYQVLGLLALCETTLFRRLSVETAAETLRVADMHDMESLKQTELNFISKNVEAVVETEGYTRLSIELVNDVLRSSLIKRGGKSRAN